MHNGPKRSFGAYVHQNHFPSFIFPTGAEISIAPKQKKKKRERKKRPVSLKHNTDALVHLPHRHREVQRTAERDSTQGVQKQKHAPFTQRSSFHARHADIVEVANKSLTPNLHQKCLWCVCGSAADHSQFTIGADVFQKRRSSVKRWHSGKTRGCLFSQCKMQQVQSFRQEVSEVSSSVGLFQ